MRKHISNFPCHFRQKDEGMRKTCGRRLKGETNEMKTDANQSQIGREKNQGQFGSSRGIRGKQLQEVVHIGNKETRVFYCNANFKNSNFNVLLLFNEGSVSNVNRKSNGFKVIFANNYISQLMPSDHKSYRGEFGKHTSQGTIVGGENINQY